MLPLLVSAATGAVNYLVNRQATKKAAAERQKNQAIIDNNMKKAEDLYNRTPNNYLDTAEGKNIVNKMGQQMQENNRQNNANNIKSGATESAKLAQAKATNKATSDIASNLAAQSTSYQRAKEDRLQNARNTYTQQQMAINNANAESYANSGANVSNAVSNLGSALIQNNANTKNLWENLINKE